MKNTLKNAGILFIIILFTSCSRSKQGTPGEDPPESSISVKTIYSNLHNGTDSTRTLASFGFNTEKELEKAGWKKITTVDFRNNTQPDNIRLKGEGSAPTLKEELDFDHVKSMFETMNVRWPQILDAYSSIKGWAPSGGSLNVASSYAGFFHSGSPEPTISQHFGWKAYAETGEPKVTEISSEDVNSEPIVGITTEVTNEGAHKDKANPNLSCKKTITTSWTSEGTGTIKLGGKIGIPLVTEGSGEISASLKGATSDTKSTEITISPSYTATIPPHTKRIIKVLLHEKKTYYKCEIPSG